MKSVGSYEAKTHLPRLLDEVVAGARIQISKNGKPVAMLIPVSEAREEDRESTIARLKAFRRGRRLDGVKVRDLIREGRRF